MWHFLCELERVQERALSMICTGLSNNCEEICKKTFYSIVNNKNNKLNNMLPGAHNSSYALRKRRRFTIPRWKTDRFRNTFFKSTCI